MVREYRTALMKTGTRLPATLRALPLPELISRDLSEYPAISATTVNKTQTLVGAIVAHAERDGYLEDVAGFVSPFRTMLVARDKSDDDGGWLCVAAVIDLSSRRVVGGSMKAEMTAQLVTDARLMAIRRRGKPEALPHHSDQGSQYASEPFQRLMADNGVDCSMSRSGTVWDNAAMESFVSSLKTERIKGRVYRTRDEARADVFDDIERFYNAARRHSTIGSLSPIAFEKKGGLTQPNVHRTGSRPGRSRRSRACPSLNTRPARRAHMGSSSQIGIASLMALATAMVARRISSTRLASAPARNGMLMAATTSPRRLVTGAAKA
jgi:transposase InsO family protein